VSSSWRDLEAAEEEEGAVTETVKEGGRTVRRKRRESRVPLTRAERTMVSGRGDLKMVRKVVSGRPRREGRGVRRMAVVSKEVHWSWGRMGAAGAPLRLIDTDKRAEGWATWKVS
jgi:hypothetical protein